MKRPTLSPQGKNILTWGSIWCAAVIFTAIAQISMDSFLFVFLWFWWLILAAFGLALLVGCGQILREERQRGLPTLIPLAATVLFLVVWSFAGGADWAQRQQFAHERRQHRERFISKRNEFEMIVSRIHSGKLPRSGEVDGVTYQCDRENPKLVSFMEPGGILDNYTAIVYDPTDSVLRINAVKNDFSNFNDPRLRSVKKLFGGDMIWAKPLGGHWYRCGFT